jgi:hypothetical protein
MMGNGILVRLPNGSRVPMVASEGEAATMMVVFGVGYVAVFVLFALMYAHAYARRDALELDEAERYETRDNLGEILLNVVMGVASIVVALRGSAQLAGFTYLAVGPVLTIHGFISGAGRRRLDRCLAAERAAAAAQSE